jgi:hypothetical protein
MLNAAIVLSAVSWVYTVSRPLDNSFLNIAYGTYDTDMTCVVYLTLLILSGNTLKVRKKIGYVLQMTT